jgi:hypothetical protein
MKTADLGDLIGEATAIDERVGNAFGSLGVAQLNWKPGEKQWSVGQCLDHLITTNKTYVAPIAAALQGVRLRTLWARLPGWPRLCGRLLLHTVDPANTSARPAPGVFQPTRSAIDGDVVARFHEQQRRLLEHMRAGAGLDVANRIISSPVSPIFPYSVLDAFRIIVAHEERHFQQASRVARAGGFARSDVVA